MYLFQWPNITDLWIKIKYVFYVTLFTALSLRFWVNSKCPFQWGYKSMIIFLTSYVWFNLWSKSWVIYFWSRSYVFLQWKSLDSMEKWLFVNNSYNLLGFYNVPSIWLYHLFNPHTDTMRYYCYPILQRRRLKHT